MPLPFRQTLPPPPPPPRKGIGCLGIGCILAGILFLFLLGLLGGAGYWLYTRVLDLTSLTRGDIPAFTDTYNVYAGAVKKIVEFQNEMKEGQPATLRLNADELNALFARDPDTLQANIFVYFTLTKDAARVQVSVPIERLTRDELHGRYANFDSTFTVAFDPYNKAVVLTPETFIVTDHVIIGENARGYPVVNSMIGPRFSAGTTQELGKSPLGAEFLARAKVIEIKDGELVIETN